MIQLTFIFHSLRNIIKLATNIIPDVSPYVFNPLIDYVQNMLQYKFHALLRLTRSFLSILKNFPLPCQS